MPRDVIVRIPTPHKGDGTGCMEYTIRAAGSSMDAARRALAIHRERIEDDDVLTVIVADRGAHKPDTYPKIQHRVGAVRRKEPNAKEE